MLEKSKNTVKQIRKYNLHIQLYTILTFFWQYCLIFSIFPISVRMRIFFAHNLFQWEYFCTLSQQIRIFWHTIQWKKNILFLHTIWWNKNIFCTLSYRIRIFLNRFIWSMDKTLTITATQGQNGPGSNGNEEVLLISHFNTTSSF